MENFEGNLIPCFVTVRDGRLILQIWLGESDTTSPLQTQSRNERRYFLIIPFWAEYGSGFISSFQIAEEDGESVGWDRALGKLHTRYSLLYEDFTFSFQLGNIYGVWYGMGWGSWVYLSIL